MRPSRRDLLAACSRRPSPAARSARPEPRATPRPHPACDDGDEPTPAQTEGPYFIPRSPEKRDFAADSADGTPMTLAGFALDPSCRPLPGALVELWHCDAAGVYDNRGYRLRGHQFADAEGRWRFDTVLPGVYPGRTRHFHLKAQPPRRPAADDPALFPGRARERPRPHLRRPPARRPHAGRRDAARPLRPRARLSGFEGKRRVEIAAPLRDGQGGRDRIMAMDDSEQAYAIFDTAGGFCGVAWGPRGVTRFQLPTSSAAATERLLRRRVPHASPAPPPPAVADAIARVRRYFAGEAMDFSDVRLDLGEQAPFFREVYAAARRVGWGRTPTYGALARDLGAGPEAARDVGQAMARNPVALLIPCHRVLAAGGKLGGFSAPGGAAAKARMLELEGVRLPSAEAQQSFGF